jgi:uncharacterized membrane protein (GlpM family)
MKRGEKGKNMDPKMLVLYFVIGGALVSAVTYFGSHAKSQIAAFIAFLPSISVITICSVYFASGTEEAVSYTKNMLILVPPWVLYGLGMLFLLPRIGLAYSLVISIAVYIGTALLIMKLT